MTKEEIWWSRNPSHDIDDKGEDRFYKTAFICMEDYARQQATEYAHWLFKRIFPYMTPDKMPNSEAMALYNEFLSTTYINTNKI